MRWTVNATPSTTSLPLPLALGLSTDRTRVRRRLKAEENISYSLGFAMYGSKSFSPPRSAAIKHTPLRSVTAPTQPS